MKIQYFKRLYSQPMGSCKKILPLSVVVLASSLTACMSLPDNSNRTISHYLPANPNSKLAERILPDNQANAGKTGGVHFTSGA